MKKLKVLSIALSLTIVGFQSNAAFKVASENKTVAVENTQATITNNTSNTTEVSNATVETTKAVKAIAKGKGGEAKVSKIAYIILAILGLGWLAIGINDGFKLWDWVIGLILTLCLYLPGLIYSLIKMKKYY